MKRQKLLLATSLALLSPSLQTVLQAQTAYSKIVTNDTPFLYWNFDEASGAALQIVDATPLPVNTSNDLVPAGATRVSHATTGSGLILGNAASFSGANYFMAEDLSASKVSLAAPWAIEFWMQAQGEMVERRNDYLLSFGAGGGNDPAVIYDYVGAFSDDNGLELFAGGRTDIGPSVSDNNWHHVVFVFYGDGDAGVADRADAYVDGVSFPNIRANFSKALNVGARLVVGTSAPQFPGDGFEGNIDELAVYDLSALATEQDVTTKMDKLAADHFATASSTKPFGAYSTAVLADSPFLYWNFDEASGNAKQLISQSPPPPDFTVNNLVPTDGVLRVQHTDIGSSLKLGGAVELDGFSSLQAADLNAGVNSLPGPWGVEFWMQTLGDNEGFLRNDYLLSFGSGGGNAPSVIYDYVNGAAEDGVEIFAGGRTGVGPIIADQNWHHLFLVYYGNGSVGLADRVEMFLDGVSVASSNRETFTSPLSLADRFIVGSSPVAADGFEGRMDEVAIYDFSSIATEGALQTKAAQLAGSHFALANGGAGAYSQGVVADKPLLYWNFNETEGNVIQQMPIGEPTTRKTDNDLLPLAGASRVSHSTIGSGLDLGNAADFSGANYFVAEDLNAPKTSLPGPYLIEFWMQVQGANNGRRNDYLMNFGGGGGNHPAVLYDYVGSDNPDNGLELFAGTRTTGQPSVNDEGWHHVVMAYLGDGTSGVSARADIYVDGALASADVRNTFSSALDVSSRLMVGNSAPQFAGGDGFQGRLDEVALYDLSTLTTATAVSAKASDIAARHYAAGKPGGAAPELGIEKAGNQVFIFWAPSAGFVLESTPTLTNPTWAPVATAPTVVNGKDTVALTASGDARFFRLRK